MAFTVNDLQDLLKLLREHPEWREEVRREILGDELLALPELVRQNSLDIQKLTERLDQLTVRVDQLTVRVDQLAESVQQLTRHVARMDVDLAEVKGDTLELWYRSHPEVIAGSRRLRKVRVPLVSELELVDAAYDSGQLSDEELDALYLVDLIILGREGRGDAAKDAVLAIEVSNTIDRNDIRRAAERAALLARVGYAAYPVVAGRSIDDRARRDAEARNVQVHLRETQASA